MPVHELPEFILNNYEVHEWRHAVAILKNDIPVLSRIARRGRLCKLGAMLSKVCAAAVNGIGAYGQQTKRP
jgi:hypothetical protein